MGSSARFDRHDTSRNYHELDKKYYALLHEHCKKILRNSSLHCMNYHKHTVHFSNPLLMRGLA